MKKNEEFCGDYHRFKSRMGIEEKTRKCRKNQKLKNKKV